MTVQHFEKATGLRLFKFGAFQIELWYVPANNSIPAHYHSEFDSKICLIFGHNVLFRRNKESILIKWLKHFGRVFAIKAKDIHSFDSSNYPLIFLNIERWRNKPSSACKDFVKVYNY